MTQRAEVGLSVGLGGVALCALDRGQLLVQGAQVLVGGRPPAVEVQAVHDDVALSDHVARPHMTHGTGPLARAR